MNSSSRRTRGAWRRTGSDASASAANRLSVVITASHASSGSHAAASAGHAPTCQPGGVHASSASCVVESKRSHSARGQLPRPNRRGAGYIVANGHAATRHASAARSRSNHRQPHAPQQAAIEQRAGRRRHDRRAEQRAERVGGQIEVGSDARRQIGLHRLHRAGQQRAEHERQPRPPACRASADRPRAPPARRTAYSRARW